MRKLSHPAQSPPMACIYVSVIYRNVKSVSLTCDSLQKAFMERTRQGSTASCLDQTTRFLNPTYQGYDVINVESSDDEEEIVTPTDHAHVNDCSSHVVSSPEDSLRLFSCWLYYKLFVFFVVFFFVVFFFAVNYFYSSYIFYFLKIFSQNSKITKLIIYM